MNYKNGSRPTWKGEKMEEKTIYDEITKELENIDDKLDEIYSKKIKQNCNDKNLRILKGISSIRNQINELIFSIKGLKYYDKNKR